ncbi:MAG: FAD-binding oxidoreductase [Gammaproteobacteria bacterium]|nr:FAD-binding oxidoreductase [Gammaproteobacteria bacterium]NIR81627.1 FAD-binding oxidoreductase [Gammaproteobacteria bacterium]NIR88178.1 FAD-binding oxidoreductase [Gammaproteobacteria bacterium]NIU02739.1 FAD-binding oxidoreductase [Gammaproteobacteria bacterium]NIV73338.1 FAD-dependent oxidoreductase [Gammaproteobacteria bacterium]
MAETYDAIVIGAGVIGAAIALELSRRGQHTLSVDKLPASGYGPTSSSCAIIRVYYSTLDGTALAYESYFDWKDWPQYLRVSDERGHARFFECGCLVMKTEMNGHLEKHCALAAELGIPHEHWHPAQIKERLPVYDLRRYGPPKRMDEPGFGEPTGGELAGGVFFPTGGYISDPQLATHNLQRAAEASGAEFLLGRAVVEIVEERGRVAGVVLDDGGRIAAPVVVNVAGPHSGAINKLARADRDMKISTKALRQEVVHLPAPAGFDFEKRGLVVSDSDIGCYCRPESGNHILVGSEDPPCDPREFVDPDDYDRDFSDQGTTQACRMGQRIPELGIPSRLQGVVDLYDVSDDWIPIYDKSAIPGFYMAIGTSGNQFKNASVVGRMMAALIEYCESGADHDAEPLQFRLEHIGRTIDVGFFSRLREVNPESSFSVLG